MVGYPQRALFLCLLFGLVLLVSLPRGAHGVTAKSTRQIRLRGQQQKHRELETMFENTNTGHHIVVADLRGPESVAVETDDGKATNTEEEEEKVEVFQPVAPRKEEPKGLYARAKSSKPKTPANKDKGDKPGSDSSYMDEPDQMNIEDFSEDEEPPMVSEEEESIKEDSEDIMEEVEELEDSVDMDPMTEEVASGNAPEPAAPAG